MEKNRSVKAKDNDHSGEKTFFQEFFSFTEEGKLKSMRFLYAFVLAILILFFYFFVQHFASLGFEKWFSDLNRGTLNFLSIAVPAIFCTAVFCGLFFLIKDRSILPLSYALALLLTLFVFAYCAFAFPAEARMLILPVVGYMFLLPCLFGTVCIILTAYLSYKKGK